MTTSNITKEVVKDLVTRDTTGQKKYNTTMDREDLTPADWLQHMYEELLDAAIYTKKLQNTELMSKELKQADPTVVIQHLNQDIADTKAALIEEQNRARELECKINKASLIIAERFDADGIDDITLPDKVSVWWVIGNLGAVAKMVSEFIQLFKQPCLPTIPE